MDEKKLLEIFPFIQRSVNLFNDQNRYLKKIILTGKICALDKAANLFSFTEKTTETFVTLKEELIPLLLEKNLHKYTDKLQSKAQISIDILIRNLFERTADVGFLATDESIIAFLNEQETSENLRKRLIEYALKYSVYNEIIITDPQGNIRLNINATNKVRFSSDPIIKQALFTEGYVEGYNHSDLFPTQHKTLLFAHKITQDNQPIGVLIVCFRFDDEMEQIFSSLLDANEHIIFHDGKEVIISSSDVSTAKKVLSNIHDTTLHKNGNVSVSAKTKGYEGYYGASWSSLAYTNIKKNFYSTSSNFSAIKCTLDPNIQNIITKADDVVEDLSDIIINGELIASKERVYVLTPVLDNLRNVSTSILSTIKETVDNLEHAIIEGLIYDVQSSAKLAIEIMDRNLYERANDCRWWAMTPVFEKELASKLPNTKRLTDLLKYINSLYTVYTNLFIYDYHSTIIASSNDPSIVGKKVSGEHITKTLSNNNSQHYFVSHFEPLPFNGDQATYLYNATISNNGKVLGGIGIVFDAYPQFQAILNDSFPATKIGFSSIIDRKGSIVSTTHPTMKPLERMELDKEIFQFNSKEASHHFITFHGKKFLVGIAQSQGYREYKRHDNYKNDLLSLTFIEY
ncbi:MAG: hypothetical protein NTY39_11085 [Campylobacterales bacterium]|nr:hypothetical protein [Campylobacterales bacterium]